MIFDIEKRTILLVRHGSHAYGLNTPTSDVDIKGVCIETAECHYGFLHRFEQEERLVSKGHTEDRVVYSLKKFASLAAGCNPNIIEVLHVADEDVMRSDAWGDILREHRDDFVSQLARGSFAGYAHAQLKRIKSHRSWLLDPPKAPPVRTAFGLPEVRGVSKSELGAFDALEDTSTLPKDIVRLLVAEKAYAAASLHWAQYQNWIATRNPARAALEAAHGYDTKHGMHLLRLMRMCREILMTGKVLVKRPDRDELLAVRNGQRPYDSLIEEAERLDEQFRSILSPLPKEPDRVAINEMVVEMTSSYLRSYG